MPSRRSLGHGSDEGFSERAHDKCLTVEIRPPKPIRNAIMVLTGKNGISETIYFSTPSPQGPSFKPPKILTAAELEEERALLRQIVQDDGMEKDDEKVPEK